MVARRAHKIKVVGSQIPIKLDIAGWSSLVARRAHNPKVVGSNPAPAPKEILETIEFQGFFLSKNLEK